MQAALFGLHSSASYRMCAQTLQFFFIMPHINVSVFLMFVYHIAENFGGRKLWRIWRFATNSPKFYPPIACNI